MDYTKPKNIFIVDDDVMLTESLSDYLTRTVSHKVSVFATGEDCLKHLDESPDIVILDYFLNTVQEDAANGMEILQTIKKNYPKVHVIMLSSQERYAVAMQTIQKGADQYVVKDKDAFKKIADMLNSI
ncbi:MAG: response regulator [Bacteroidota bacterium]